MSLVPVIGMMDGSTSAAAREDTLLYHSTGKNNSTNEAAGQCGGQKSWGEFSAGGKIDSPTLELCKTQRVVFALIVVMLM